MATRITRRSLAQLALVPAAAASMQPPPQPENAEQELAAAGQNVQRNFEAMSKVTLPIETEPAFQFKA